MGRAITYLTFEEWLAFAFDHPESGPRRHHDWRADFWDAPPSLTVDYLTRTFEQAAEVLAPYTDAQVANGLWFLFSGQIIDALDDVSVLRGAPWPARRRGLLSMYELFAQCFAPRCSRHLSHLDEPGANPLNVTCYMWWDMYPSWGRPNDPGRVEEDQVLMSVMLRILRIDSAPCRESALHGLGHWQLHYPEAVQKAIDEFLVREPRLRPELRAYARRAKRGMVQ